MKDALSEPERNGSSAISTTAVAGRPCCTEQRVQVVARARHGRKCREPPFCEPVGGFGRPTFSWKDAHAGRLIAAR